ncbi:MAG: hypothetical protein ICV77_18500, partial [Cyanobacteria bacterium Co-bin8]|nr:hypothetical protein [Cyanobacteria bacterium Co-bin8]
MVYLLLPITAVQPVHQLSRVIMSQSFLAAAHQGRNAWWRYVLAIVLILFFWFILGSIPYAIALGM